MLKRFPGRTLEEIDEMDWARYTRAMEAAQILDLEEKKVASAKGLIKPSAISAADWERIGKLEDLMEEYENGQSD